MPASAVISKRLFVAIALLVLLQTVLWSFRGSGVARLQLFNAYPEGYIYVLDDHFLGRFPAQREDLRYIRQYLEFLGNDKLGTTGVWPAQRSLYAYLLSGLWPLGFILGAIVLNLAFWIAAIWGAAEMMRIFGGRTDWCAALAAGLTALHQGFLWSVGETNPHAAGYASGFLILGSIGYMRCLEREVPYASLVKLFALTSFLSMLYHTAIFFLPLVVAVGARRELLVWRARGEPAWNPIVRLAALLAIVLLPSFLFKSLLYRIGLLVAGASTAGIIYETMLPKWAAGMEFWGILREAALSLMAGFAAFGPFLLPAAVWGIWRSLARRDRAGICAAGYLFLLMVALIPNLILGDAGYASVNLMPFVTVLAALGLDDLLRICGSTGLASRVFLSVYFAASLAYVNLPMFGCQLPLGVAWGGYYSSTQPGKFDWSWVVWEGEVLQ